MTAFPWKISGKGVLRSGVVEAASDREALAQVLGGKVGFSPVPTESYSITVGPLTTSAYGDEFERVAGSTKIDESQLDTTSGHLFNDPVRRQLEDRARAERAFDETPVYPGALLDQMRRAEQPCPANAGGHHSFNLDSHIRKGDAGTFKHGRCTCGAITPTPVDSQPLDGRVPLRPTPVDVRIPGTPINENLKRQLDRLDEIGKQAIRAKAQQAMDELLAKTPVDTGRFRRPTHEEGKSQQAPLGILEGAIRRAVDADAAHREELARRHVVNLACAKAQGGWRPEHARRITRRQHDCTVDVEFDDGQVMEKIRLTDREIADTRF